MPTVPNKHNASVTMNTFRTDGNGFDIKGQIYLVYFNLLELEEINCCFGN